MLFIIQYNTEFVEDGQPEIPSELQENGATDSKGVMSELLAESDDVAAGPVVLTWNQRRSNRRSTRCAHFGNGKCKSGDRSKGKSKSCSPKKANSRTKRRYQRLQQQIDDTEREIEELRPRSRNCKR